MLVVEEGPVAVMVLLRLLAQILQRLQRLVLLPLAGRDAASADVQWGASVRGMTRQQHCKTT
jgi:hypothetical protein